MNAERQVRKATYRLYPTPRQSEALRTLLRSPQQLYNAALQERIDAWQKSRVSIGFAAQCPALT
jgi:putative transposase